VVERTTELRQALNSERSLSQLIEKSLNEIFIFDADSYKFLFVNNGARTNTGYSQTELLKMTPLDLTGVDLATFEEILAPLKKQQKETVTFETVHKRKDGSTYQVEIYFQKSVYRSRPVFAAIMLDVTQRKEMLQRYQELVEGTTNLIIQVDGQGKFLYVNHMGKYLFGSDPAQLIGQNAFHFVHFEDYEMTQAWFEDCLKKQVSQGNIENRQVNQVTGEIHDLLWTTNFHYDDQGQLVSANGIAKDITERKKAEMVIHKREEQWYRTFNSFTDIVTLLSPDLKIVKANMAAYNALDLSWEDVINHRCYEIFNGTKGPCHKCPLLETKKTLKPFTREIFHHKLDKTFLVTTSPIFDKQGELEYIAHIAKDISEMKQLQSQLLQSQKMEAIGLMAGGMAHNFNNNLAIILGNVELAQIKQPADNDIVDYLKNAKIAVLRSRDLIQHTMMFSRKETKDIITIQPALVIDETLSMLHPTIPSTVNLQQVINTNSYDISIKANPSRIQEMLLNLCTNAVHAMDEQGDLTISLESVELQKQDIPVQREYVSEFYAKLCIQDNGSGMTEETQTKIFDPFFTTKEIGKGTGMGLSTVYGIMEQYNGWIKVKSAPGQGTTFELYFPVLEQPQATEMTPISSDLPKGTEKILFIDDDEMLAQVGEVVLSEMGYQVVTMKESTEALKLFAANPDHFDLVITDQTMPDLSGKDLIRELLKIRPDLPTILCTGFSNKVDKAEAKELGVGAFCMKPLDLPELLQTVRAVLDASSLSGYTD